MNKGGATSAPRAANLDLVKIQAHANRACNDLFVHHAVSSCFLAMSSKGQQVKVKEASV